MLALKSLSRNIIEFGWIETARRCIVAIEQKNSDQLLLYVGVGIGISLLGTLRQFFLKQYGRFSVYVMLKSLYKKIYTKLIRIDPQSYEETGTGKISGIISEGSVARTTSIDNIIDEGIMFIINFSVALGYIYFLMGLNYVIGGVVIILLFIVYAGYFEKKYQYLRKERNAVAQESNRHRQKVIMHKQDILVNNKVEQEGIKQGEYYDKIIYRTKKMLVYITLQSIGLDIKNIINYGLYFFLGTQIIQGNISLSSLTTILLVNNNIFEQITVLTTIRQQLSENQFKIKVMNDFLSNNMFIGYEGGYDFDNVKSHITFNNITFSYSKGSIIFKDFNINLQGGKKTALVGSSGSGKTTIAKLIAGNLYPNVGSIEIGKQVLPNTSNSGSNNYISLKSYYRHIGYLTQEPSVFDGSIKDNLMYAVSDQDISEDRVKEIIALAQCDWIYDLKDGLDTEIGEKGIKLSGGQRQRLAIAKIMLKDPSIILLDEPTSALDSFAEEEVTKAMNNLFEGRTVIIIAHRLQTVKHADEIIVLGNEEGKIGTQILERGNHQELIAKGGFYAKMLELQSGF